ncbi:MAG TPA: DUF3105 domain-containing protein [Gaiellaceae bacterium]|nr:DUF3105 domain-containing protein [Gaiellaceae bacterium]
MAEKPRVKAPKQRQTTSSEASSQRRMLTIGAAVAGVVIGFAVVAVLLGLIGGSDGPDEAAVRADLEAAGCTLQAVEAQPGRHSLAPDGTAKWNTDPPTSGPHFGFNPNGSVGTVIWGAYEEPVQLARIIHNLEHGGVYIFYGDEVSDEVVAQLSEFYEDHRNGTVLAPYPKLGDKVALGAWVTDNETGSESTGGTGYLAKCGTFDEGAFSSFLSGFQFHGPERFPSDSLLPGGT